MVEKEFTIDNLTPLGKGGTGECFRVDEDKILKLYYDGMPKEMAYREKECARTALIIGVPTPISYDVVRVGERRGVIYEILNARTMSQAIVDNPDNIAKYAKEYADIAKSLRSVKGDADRFGKATEIFREALPHFDYLDEAAIGRIASYLDYLDTFDRYVHGDFQPNNVMVDDKNVMLIDLGGFSVGNPVIDLATTYFCFFASPDALYYETSPFTGMTKSQHAELWEKFISAYYGVRDYEEAKELYSELKDIDDIVLLLQMRFDAMFPMLSNKDYAELVRRLAVERWCV